MEGAHLGAQVEGDPAVAWAQRAAPYPDHLAGGGEGIEQGGAVVEAGGQHLVFEDGGGDGGSLQSADRLEEGFGSGRLLSRCRASRR